MSAFALPFLAFRKGFFIRPSNRKHTITDGTPFRVPFLSFIACICLMFCCCCHGSYLPDEYLRSPTTHENQDADETGAGQPQPDETNNGQSSSDPDTDEGDGDQTEIGAPCQGFAIAVESINYGAGAGFGQNRFPDIILGPPMGIGTYSGSTDVLSLGAGGEIILDVGKCIIIDGIGPDFTVFENVFLISGDPDHPYAELATVSVSADGTEFVDFPCDSDSYPYTGCAGWNPVYSNPDNDISPFNPDESGGESYDLNDIGVENAQFIRIRATDSYCGSGSACGFDLDAIAVINGETDN